MPVVMYPIKLSFYIYIYIYTEYFRIRDTTGKKVIPNVKVSRKYTIKFVHTEFHFRENRV